MIPSRGSGGDSSPASVWVPVGLGVTVSLSSGLTLSHQKGAYYVPLSDLSPSVPCTSRAEPRGGDETGAVSQTNDVRLLRGTLTVQ